MENLSHYVDASTGTVSRKIFIDPDIYRQEQAQIFGKCWLFLAHESQLTRPGDFFNTYMGEDPILVTRRSDGTIGAYLNACRHRGMRVCRADRGNAKAFMCNYHGWTYDLSGRLVSLPEAECYSSLDRDQWGLVPVTSLQTYKGLIFGNWDAEAPDLEEYLGEFAFYLDALLDRGPEGTEVIGGVAKWVFDGNWKLAAEQFASDVYHAPVSHASVFMAQLEEGAPMPEVGALRGVQYNSPNGHGVGFVTGPDEVLPGLLASIVGPDLVPLHDRAEVHARGEAFAKVKGHSTLFPNLSWLYDHRTLRVWHPKGPDRMEIWSWTIVDKDWPEEAKQQQRKVATWSFSVSGLAEQDDGENWAEIQRTSRGYVSGSLDLNYQMSLDNEWTDDALFPGRLSNMYSDAAARRFYGRWAELMDGPPPVVPSRNHTKAGQ